jgi:translation elongation factor EF-G
VGAQASGLAPESEPVLTYKLILPEGTDPQRALLQLRQLEEEEPQLHIHWNERRQETQIHLMGQVQLEILKTLIWERFGLEVQFGPARFSNRETMPTTWRASGIMSAAPYAEVHLMQEPGELGAAALGSSCPEDVWKATGAADLAHLSESASGLLTGRPSR